MSNVLFNILKKRETILVLIIIVFSIVISSRTPVFLTYANITSVLLFSTVTGIFSLGVLIVIISGNVDVAFTAIAQVVQYAVIYFLIHMNTGNIYLAMTLAIAIGTLMGLFNGFLIHHYNMPGIIITIATQSFFYGLLHVITGGTYINVIPQFFHEFAAARVFTVPSETGGHPVGFNVVTIIWFLMAAGLAFFLRYTITGRSIYLMGSNRNAAHCIGINMFRTTLLVYGAIGGIAAVASIVHAANIHAVIPTSLVGRELDVIAAVVLGGASITGGRGTVLGTLLGVILFGIIQNSLVLMRIPSFWFDVVTGSIIIVSIVVNALQELRQRRNVIRVKVAA